MDTLPWSKAMVNFIDWFLGKKVLYEVSSRFNGKLQVTQDLFGKRLLAQNLTQSGPYIEKLWQLAFYRLDVYPKSVLILGLGAGSCIKPLQKKWPKAEVVGVEIDPKMIEIGKKFFKLSDFKVKIAGGDAFKYLEKSKSNFDLVIVDLFAGDKFPKEAEGDDFLVNLRKITNQKGLIIFNRLYFGGHKKSTQKYEVRLKKIFNVSSFYYPRMFPANSLIFCENK